MFDMKKINESKTRMTFSMHKWKFPSEKAVVWGSSS